ncbi:MAG: tetratricopeptide repeat protein [Flavisolibacter sp.]
MEKASNQAPPELVRQQLEQLLKQEGFKRSPILAKFLELVVITKLSSREDEIKEYTIAVKALGRSVDFNPQFDAVVRIHARRLRTVLSEYYEVNGKDDPVIITIPKGTYVPIFEINSKGEKRHEDKGQSETNGHEPTTVFQSRNLAMPVLAVIPFVDLSPEQSNDDFLAAMGEQLSSELARFDNLSVISFYATRKIDAAVRDMNALKNEGIDYILTGSLRLLNGTLRLNIQLIIVGSGKIVWSESFLRHQLTKENAFDVQDEIISQIANAIGDDPKMVSTMNRSMPWKNQQEKNVIQDAISQYYDYSYDYDSRKFAGTLVSMENAYEICADNALIASILSKLYLDQYACVVEKDTMLLEKGIELAKKAIWLDQRSQHAQKALAWGLILAGNKARGEEAIDACISINPSASSSLSTLGLGLIMMGEYENGYTMLQQALKLQQHASACAKLGFSLYYYQTKNYNESSRWLKRLPPFDTPFSSLLSLALDGNLTGKVVQPDELVLQIKGHEKDIVDRIVLDPKLRGGIIDGWKLAGLVA